MHQEIRAAVFNFLPPSPDSSSSRIDRRKVKKPIIQRAGQSRQFRTCFSLHHRADHYHFIRLSVLRNVEKSPRVVTSIESNWKNRFYRESISSTERRVLEDYGHSSLIHGSTSSDRKGLQGGREGRKAKIEKTVEDRQWGTGPYR